MSKAEEKAQAAYPAWRNGIGDEFNSNSAYYGFIEGYNQAEKDLRDISWIKEISGVKELSRAKEEALKAYPPQSIAANYDTINRRDAFEYGYLKAEKDLELTWEDIRELQVIFAEVDVDIEICKTDIKAETLGYYQEVLKRFKERKVEEVDLDVMQRMKECPYRQVGCTMYEGKILECKGACSWVVDYQKLKDLKHRK